SLLVSPLLSPLPARSSQGEDEELDAALPTPGHWEVRLDISHRLTNIAA
ncbi:MAG: hypothetical protein HW398_969, partial [Acidobacteria bacterium]|nr:hypothetical protein [Acidobacteriota bacterium]